MFKDSSEVLKYIKDEGVEMVDVRFCDLPGVMQHFTVPVSSFDESVFEDGLARKGEYRRFVIRGVEGQNDVASMHEVMPNRWRTVARLIPF